MTSPINSVQGLASGIKWQDIIDQLMQVDTTNELTPIQNKSATDSKSVSAWNNYGSLASTLHTAASGLADGSAFAQVSVSAPNSALTDRTLLTASASSTAAPGTYGVQVLGLATAQQLSGNVVQDATAALGVSGQFVVGGAVVTVASTDSLNALRDKINAANTGATPSGVTATILHTGASAARLVLTSGASGAAGVDIRDARSTSSDPSVLTQLGFISGSKLNTGTDGAVRSANFVSSSQKIAAMALGVSVYPAPATIVVNGRTVTVDLQNQSLTDIAAMINSASPNSASVEAVTTSSGSQVSRLKITGSVAASANPASQPILDFLGITRGATGAVSQQVSTSNVLQASDGSTATTSTLLNGLKIAGGTGAQIGDTFTITGTKADGVTPVSFTTTVDGSMTVNDFLSSLSTAFSATGRGVSAALVGGKIQLTDTTGGDSGLSFSISSDNAGGGTLAFGATSTTTVGRARELAAGADARLLVNGVSITRSTNTITDAIAGVTLNLQQAESGTTIPVTVSRDSTRTVQALETFANAYNALQSFVTSSTATGGDLAFNGAVRQSFNSIKNSLLGSVPGLVSGAAYTSAPLVGVSLDKTGKLTIDETAVQAALSSNPDAFKALFATNGVADNTNFNYLSSSSATAAGTYTANITRAATKNVLASSAANFVYSGGVSDTMTIADSISGKSGSISLANGDTPDTVSAKLNALFQAQGLRLSASVSNGTLSVSSLDYGSSASITTSFSSAGVGTQLGLAAATTRNGLDVQGTYSSGGQTYTATGAGQTLTGSAGTPVEGLIMQYTGSADTATSRVDFAVGIAGIASRIANEIGGTDGVVSKNTDALNSDIAFLSDRQTAVQARLDAKRAALTAQFTAMETALSKIQAQGQWLTQQLSVLNGTSSQSSG